MVWYLYFTEVQQFQSMVEFHYHTIPFWIFWGRNETARLMVKILQVLTLYQQWHPQESQHKLRASRLIYIYSINFGKPVPKEIFGQ